MKIPFRPLLVWLLGSLLPGVLPAAEMPPAYQASYEVYADGHRVGVLQRRFGPLGDGRYVVQTDNHTTGFSAWLGADHFRETTTLDWGANGPRPLLYRYEQPEARPELIGELRFDWAKRQLRGKWYTQTIAYALAPGMLDNQTWLLALAADLAAGRTALTYTVAEAMGIRHYRLKLGAAEELKTALGPLTTLRLTEETDDGGVVAQLWCAPTLHYLPVRLEHSGPEGSYGIRLQTVDFDAEKAR